MQNNFEKQRFGSLDGLRAISCLGIMCMHIYVNMHLKFENFFFTNILPSFNDFVFLFMMISGFGMCVGYLEKIQNGKIDFETFYIKRYKKLLPFFSFLMVVAFLVEPSFFHFFDVSMEFTLLYGFLPNNNLDVIGVGWTIGVIFIFYLLFPAFSVLVKKRKRAWLFLLISLWISFICQIYYFSEKFVNDLFIPRHSFIYCLPFFLVGGLIYLYKDLILKIFSTNIRWLCLFFNILVMTVSFFIPTKIVGFDVSFYKSLLVFSLWLIYCVGVDSKFFDNKLMHFLSGVSMEIYLCHMFVFRTWEKLGLLRLFGNGFWTYLFICVLTLLGALSIIGAFRIFIYLVLKTFKKKEV